jgi:hypothetical protein
LKERKLQKTAINGASTQPHFTYNQRPTQQLFIWYTAFGSGLFTNPLIFCYLCASTLLIIDRGEKKDAHSNTWRDSVSRFSTFVFFIKQYLLGPCHRLKPFWICFEFAEIWSLFGRKNRACGVIDAAWYSISIFEFRFSSRILYAKRLYPLNRGVQDGCFNKKRRSKISWHDTFFILHYWQCLICFIIAFQVPVWFLSSMYVNNFDKIILFSLIK